MKKLTNLTISILTLLSINLSAQQLNIHDAIKKDSIELVKSILKENPDAINELNHRGWTPLLTASFWTKLDIVKYFAASGVDLYKKRDNGVNAVHWAVHGIGNAKAKMEMVKLLLSEAPELADEKTVNGITPLHWSGNELEETITLLLQNGADINSKDKNGHTALHQWAKYWANDRSEFLLQKGANISVKDKNGQTPLHGAAIIGRLDRTKMFLDHDAEINATDKLGFTALDYAYKYAHQEVATLLIKNGAKQTNETASDKHTDLLTHYYNEKEAAFWYCDEDGWAVKTKNHFLIFNYPSWGIKPLQPGVSNGRINLEELEEENITVFVSNKGSFNRKIPQWAQESSKINFVLGMPREELPEATVLDGNFKTDFNNIKIQTIKTSESGVAFIIDVDGMKILHAGDLALNNQSDWETFANKIQTIKKENKKIDILIMPIHVIDTKFDQVAKGILHTIKELNPKIYFPSHQGSNTLRYRYHDMAKLISENNLPVKVLMPENRGDRFLFQNGKIE